MYRMIHHNEVVKRLEHLGYAAPNSIVSSILGDQWSMRLPPLQKKFFQDKAEEETRLHSQVYPWYDYEPERKKGKRAGSNTPDITLPGYLDLEEVAREYHEFVKNNNLQVVLPVAAGHPKGLEKYNAPELFDSVMTEYKQKPSRRGRKSRAQLRAVVETAYPNSTQSEIEEPIQEQGMLPPIPTHTASSKSSTSAVSFNSNVDLISTSSQTAMESPVMDHDQLDGTASIAGTLASDSIQFEEADIQNGLEGQVDPLFWLNYSSQGSTSDEQQVNHQCNDDTDHTLTDGTLDSANELQGQVDPLFWLKYGLQGHTIDEQQANHQINDHTTSADDALAGETLDSVDDELEYLFDES
ncbi:hypothetical protein F4819DRAFT_502264 [Hypoxylon fuscum]|nr:hypothetical protein F4819DRAFT_502264 [Hypoxylon fuscum]